LNRPKETPLEFFSRFKGLKITRRKDLPRKIAL
jgi:hypothetical protein